MKIEELDKRHQVEKKIASIERRHQLAASRMGDDLSQNGGHRKDIESLPQESVKDKVDRMFSKMGDSSAQKGSGIRTASQPSDPILKVAEAILKTQKPNIKPFSGDYGKYSGFRASFKQLEEQGYYNENELLNLLLTNVKGEAETALQGILPNSSEYYEAWRILEKRFGDPIKIVQSYRRALKSSPSVLEKNAAQLRSLTDKVTSLISVFKSLGRTGDLLSDSYVEDVLEKLPTLLKTRWIDIIKVHPERRTLRSFGKWLEDHTHTWDIAQGNLDPSSSKLKSEGKSSHKTRSFKTDMTSLVSTCPFHFKKGHSVSQCRMFKRLSPSERFKLMVEKGLCFSYFAKHLRKDWKATVNCQVGGCKGHHHTLLHEINSRENRFREATPSNQVQDASSIQTSTAATAATVTPTTTGISATQTLATETEPQRSSSTEHMPYSACAQIAPCQVAHPLIPVFLYGPNGQRLKTLCLLDTGSNATLVLQALAEKVGFTGELGEISLGGTNTSEVVRSFPVDSLGISGVGRRQRRYTTHSALTVPALNSPEYVVDWPADKEKYPHLQNLPLQCTDASKIGSILGLPEYRLQIPLECREGPRGSPTAIRTKLGWVAFSHVPAHSRTIQVCRISVDSGVDAGVEDSLSISQHFEKWFNDEAIPVPKRKNEIRSIEDEKAYKLLKENTERIPGMNAFESGILWRDSAPVIPNNRKVAEAHLGALEKRLEREPALKSAYDASIVSDVTNGYIRKNSKEEVASVESSSSTMVHYLLHHPVRNPKKPGKLDGCIMLLQSVKESA